MKPGWSEPSRALAVVPPLPDRDPRAVEVHRRAKQGIDTADYLRSLVLGYRDLADRLTLPPIGYATAKAWNGFVPPSKTAGDGGSMNTSPRRRALVELCAEAITRSRGAGEADDWKRLIA